MSEDVKSRLLATFGAEAAERVAVLQRDVRLLEAQTDAAAREPLLDGLVREAHSLKGAARAVGADGVETLAGRIEDLFERLGTTELRPDPAVGDVVRPALEALDALVREATRGEPAGVDVDAVAATLEDRADRSAPADEIVPVPRSTLEALLAAAAGLVAATAEAQRAAARLERAVTEIHGLLPRGTAPPVPAARRPVVLVVENSATTRTVQKHLLEQAGYEVLVAGDGGEAWGVLQRADVDIVVSDILMPGLDGFELTARIRAEHDPRNLPVVLVTSTDAAEGRERSAAVGADAYLVKGSIGTGDLATAIARLT